MPNPDPLAQVGLEPAEEEETTPPADNKSDEEEIQIPEGAENPDAVRNAIRNERKAAREANAKARELEAQIRERESKQKPLEAQVAEQQALREAAELRALRYEVAAETGLDPTLAPRLVGYTREELVADASSFATQIGERPKPPAVVPPEGGSREPLVRVPDGKTSAGRKEIDKQHGALIGALVSGRPQSGDGLFKGLEPAPVDDE